MGFEDLAEEFVGLRGFGREGGWASRLVPKMRLGFHDLADKVVGLRGFGQKSCWASRIWPERWLGFEDLAKKMLGLRGFGRNCGWASWTWSERWLGFGKKYGQKSKVRPEQKNVQNLMKKSLRIATFGGHFLFRFWRQPCQPGLKRAWASKIWPKLWLGFEDLARKVIGLRGFGRESGWASRNWPEMWLGFKDLADKVVGLQGFGQKSGWASRI